MMLGSPGPDGNEGPAAHARGYGTQESRDITFADMGLTLATPT